MDSLDREDWMNEVRSAEAPLVLGTLHGFEVLHEVARGGQGIVYKVRDSGSGRFFALKRLIAGTFATPSMRARFEREIAANAVLDHPNIVRLHGVDGSGGDPVFAMEWIDGLAISVWARARKPSLPSLLATIEKVCSAVHHAHQRGILHRDLKPTNVLVDAADEPHVLDFGLAKILEDGPGSAGPWTATVEGNFLGTPLYASPEQLRGDPVANDVRSDVWSLGAILYEMLTGRMPYQNAGTLPAMLEAIEKTPVPRPSSLVPGLPRELDAIVMQTLAIEQERRYATVEALIQDLRRYAAGEVISAHPPSSFYLLRKAISRHRVAAALALATLVTLLVAVILTSTQAKRLEAERDRAERATTEAKEAAERLARTNERLRETVRFASVELLMGVEGNEASGTMPVDLLWLPAERHLPRYIAECPEVEHDVRSILARVHLKLRNYQQAFDHVQLAGRAARKHFGEDSAELAGVLTLKALLHLARFEYGPAEVAARRACEIFARTPGGTAEVRFDAQAALGNALYRAARYDEAAKAVQASVDTLRKHDRTQGRTLSGALGLLASIHCDARRFPEAEAAAREALAVTPRLPPFPDAVVEDAKLLLQGVLWAAGKHAEAKQLGAEQLGELRAAENLPPLVLATFLARNADWHTTHGKDHASALELIEEALTIQRAHAKPDATELGGALRLRGYVLEQLGRLEDAEASYVESRKCAFGDAPVGADARTRRIDEDLARIRESRAKK